MRYMKLIYRKGKQKGIYGEYPCLCQVNICL